jgi:hypothetical protein
MVECIVFIWGASWEVVARFCLFWDRHGYKLGLIDQKNTENGQKETQGFFSTLMVFHVYVDGRCSPPNPLHIVRGSPIEISKPVLVSAKNHYPTDYRRHKPRSVHVVLLFQLSIFSTIEMMFGES